MKKLTDLQNIGKVLANNLVQIGINEPQQFFDSETKTIFLKIREILPDACLDMLYAIEGAKRDLRWHNLPNDIKNELKQFYKSLVQKDE